MRKLTTVLAGMVLLGAAGFASAGIVTHGNFLAALTGTTATTGTGTTNVTTGTTPVGRRVTICHRTGSKTNPFHTITVDQHAVPAHLRHGDSLGACTPLQLRSTKGPATSHGKKKTGTDTSVKGKTGVKGKAGVKGKTAVHGKAGVKGKAGPKGNTAAKGKSASAPANTSHGNSGNSGNGNGGGNGANRGNNGNGGGQGGGGGHGNGNGHGK